MRPLRSAVLGSAFALLALSAGAAESAPPEKKKLPAFPGAEGFGTETPGGRGGKVIKVTNLNASGPGSLQAACSTKGRRIVVFDVSGVIRGDVLIEHGGITIAGQTAPGGGVTIRGRLRSRWRPKEPVEDIVIRFLRVRPGPSKGVTGDAVALPSNSRVVIDHVSCSWGTDETVDIYESRDVTVQWCTIEESDTKGHSKGQHNYGLINGPKGGRVSIHHNLFAHHVERSPAVAAPPADVRNNVVYNFYVALEHAGHKPKDGGFNIVGNFYARGPNSPKTVFPFNFKGAASYFMRDNLIEGVGLVQDPWAERAKLKSKGFQARDYRRVAREFAVPPVATQAPREAYELVLKQAGCFPRDAVTKRMIEETRAGTGSWGRHEPDDLMAGLDTAARPPEDSDGDGMPDAWEQAAGLDPADGSDHSKRMPSGYTAIEDYLNQMAARRIAGARRGEPEVAR